MSAGYLFFEAVDIAAAIHNRRQMSQTQFARLLALSVRALQSWERGVRSPSKPTMRLLQIFDQPEAFRAVPEPDGVLRERV